MQEFLREVMGIPLSIGVLWQCIQEAAVAAVPLEDKLVEDLMDDVLRRHESQANALITEGEPAADAETTEPGAGETVHKEVEASSLTEPQPSVSPHPPLLTDGVLHIDESPWKQKDEVLWLWVFITRYTVCYWITRRTRELIDNVLPADFDGWIMSDGYQVYRSFHNRLRCWPHLMRKTRGLIESLDSDGRAFGLSVHQLMEDMRNDILEWRKTYPDRRTQTDELAKKYVNRLDGFRRQCHVLAQSEHGKTASLAKEFLNDWDTLFRVLSYPWLPLSNNEAERALRHWVLLRRMSHGTKSDTGSRSLALLASVIDTCRLRSSSPLDYLSSVIQAARSGTALPPLPSRGD